MAYLAPMAPMPQTRLQLGTLFTTFSGTGLLQLVPLMGWWELWHGNFAADLLRGFLRAFSGAVLFAQSFGCIFFAHIATRLACYTSLSGPSGPKCLRECRLECPRTPGCLRECPTECPWAPECPKTSPRCLGHLFDTLGTPSGHFLDTPKRGAQRAPETLRGTLPETPRLSGTLSGTLPETLLARRARETPVASRGDRNAQRFGEDISHRFLGADFFARIFQNPPDRGQSQKIGISQFPGSGLKKI